MTLLNMMEKIYPDHLETLSYAKVAVPGGHFHVSPMRKGKSVICMYTA
jgi:hypothetical protein